MNINTSISFKANVKIETCSLAKPFRPPSGKTTIFLKYLFLSGDFRRGGIETTKLVRKVSANKKLR